MRRRRRRRWLVEDELANDAKLSQNTNMEVVKIKCKCHQSVCS